MSAVLLTVSVISFLFSNIAGIPPLLLQVISLICAVAGVYVAVRYMFTSFTYSITAKNGSADVTHLPAEAVDFCVSRIQGSRGPVTECRLSVDRLTQVLDYTDGLPNELRQKHGKVSMYNYTVSMLSPKRHALIFDDGGEYICVVIEADERFISAVSSYIPSADTGIYK